jgi:hypothetical protein
MNLMYERCAGLDVHKKTVVGCANIPDAQGQRQKQRQTFSTMLPDLHRLRAWLKELGVTHVAMESTGSYWKPIFNVLEGHARGDGGECSAPQGSSWTQNGRERCRMDC